MFSFPDGVGFELSEPLLYNAMINDVRASGSSPLRFELELAVKLGPGPARRNVGLWYVGHESDANAFAMLRGSQSFYTFTIPIHAESVSWATCKVTCLTWVPSLTHHEPCPSRLHCPHAHMCRSLWRPAV